MPLLPNVANTEGNNQGQDDRTALPAGSYLMDIVKTEFKQNSKKTGSYLAMQLKVAEGESKGRIVFENLNLDNPNPVAVEIANKTLNSICQACGLEGVEDSDELLNIPMTVTVKVRAADSQWPESNDVVSYASADEFDASESTESDTGTPEDNPNKEGSSSGLPWEKI